MKILLVLSLLLFKGIITFSQNTASGTHQLNPTSHGYTLVTWYTQYEFTFLPAGTVGGSVYIEFKNNKISLQGALYKYEDHLFKPTDLGLTNWDDNEKKYANTVVDLSIFYDGKLIRFIDGYLLNTPSLKLGQFHYNRVKDISIMTIGNLDINYNDFVLSKLTARFGEWKGVTTIRSSIEQKIEQKIFNFKAEKTESLNLNPLNNTAVQNEITKSHIENNQRLQEESMAVLGLDPNKKVENYITDGIVLLNDVINTERQRKLKKEAQLQEKKDMELQEFQKNMKIATAKSVEKTDVEKELENIEKSMIYVTGGLHFKGVNSKKIKSNLEIPIKSFYISRHEITVGQYKAFCKATLRKMPDLPFYNTWENNSMAMHSVTYTDSYEFTVWLSRKTGRNFRLPTEWEWEYAANGGIHKSGFHYSGSNKLKKVAFVSVFANVPSKVGAYQPNKLGIYDMSGNVWEWCSPEAENISESKSLKTTWNIIRGGSFRNNEKRIAKSITYRLSAKTNWKDISCGFRVVCIDPIYTVSNSHKIHINNVF